MDRQSPPNRPAISLLGVLLGLDMQRCYDITLSRQEGSTMRHLVNALSRLVVPVFYTGRLFLVFGRTGRADRQIVHWIGY